MRRSGSSRAMNLAWLLESPWWDAELSTRDGIDADVVNSLQLS